MNSFHLTLVLALPLLGALAIAVLAGKEPRGARVVALFFTGMTLLGTIALSMRGFNPAGGFQLDDQVPWIATLGISYHVGVDGLAMAMLLLNALLVFLATMASWKVSDRPVLYYVLLLLLEAGVAGVFAARDLLVFFCAWELELIPMYFLIAIWGGPRRQYAAMKFLLYTLGGSALMLLAFIALYLQARQNPGIPYASDMGAILSVYKNYWHTGPYAWAELPLFLLLFVPFAIKLPSFPFHTWLPDAHVEASTPISVLLAGILLKMGGYGLIRFNWTLFPDLISQIAPFLIALGVWNILYGAMVATRQQDMKKVIAYSSVSHMGFVLLGLAAMNAAGINGAVWQLISHGLITAMLFLGVGIVYERTRTRDITKLGGLAPKMPVATFLFAIAALASLGLPGMSGFLAEFLTFVGAFAANPIAAALAAIGIILTAFYMLWLLQRVYFQAPRPEFADVCDCTAREGLPLFVLAALVVAIGICPALLGTTVTAFVHGGFPGL
ncbi:MAG: NADH-quinone oxidoreductase subunit M [Cyanobacteria bacterium REEB65]|nr:NADH-quinone oxidoreductase subunit M [Cyanobacteria bacterium REEB65]